MEHDSIAVVDFGGQYAHLIVTKMRSLGVMAETVKPTDSSNSLRKFRGVVLSGSPSSVGRQDGEQFLKLGVPVLGICYGHQFIVERFGGAVEKTQAEYGPALLSASDHVLLRGTGKSVVWMSHGDAATRLPSGFSPIGETKSGERVSQFAAIADDSRRIYGVQFHPEVDDSEKGDLILSNFVFGICKCLPTWKPKKIVEMAAEKLAESISTDAFIFVSGGVDSTVCAALAAKAVGSSRIKLVHIDNGFMRLMESSRVEQDFRSLGMSVKTIDASNRFISAIQSEIDPERKRKIVGDVFTDILEEQLSRLGPNTVAIQGTIYPDTIETGGTSGSDVIKTHHNRVPSMLKLISEGRMLEPLRDLYKAEVRSAARMLDIPAKMIDRHPFPGPGLSIRVLCSDGSVPHGHADAAASVSRPDCMVLPFKSVGVKGDGRCYEHPAAVWGMSQREAAEAAVDLCKTPGVNRCLLSLTGRVESAVPVKATVTRSRLDLLRRIDYMISHMLVKYGVDAWQCPVALAPVMVNGRECESVVIRPVKSERGMTASPVEIPDEMVRALRRQLLSMDMISAVFLDMTTKPPATIEME